MLLEIGAAGLVATGGAYALARRRRASLYERQRQDVARLVHAHPLALQLERHAVPDFASALVRVPNFLPTEVFERLRNDVLGLRDAERSYIPTHKSGGTVAYEALITYAPTVVAYYHSAELMRFFSRVIGTEVGPTPIQDQSSLSVLFYDRPADHIGWHYDHNFYRGRHFTALMPIINQGSAPGGLSHAALMARLAGREVSVTTEANCLILFEGSVVRHRVAALMQGERRLVISMTCCTDPRSHLWQGVARRFKDTAFFGLRALWT